MPIIVPRGPALFSRCLGHRPPSYKKEDVNALHEKVLNYVVRTFKKIGGPELRPIITQALEAREFDQIARNSSHQEGIDFEGHRAVTFTKIKEGGLVWHILYNLDALRLSAAREPASNIMAHEITSTIYGVWVETLNLLRGESDKIHFFGFHDPDEFNFEMSIASEGLATLFSHVPISPAHLLQAEMMAALVDRFPEAREDLRKVWSDRHVFAAMVLLKIEMAEGFEALVQLMHRPPGVTETQTGIELRSPLDKLIQLYKSANAKLGMPTIQADIIFNSK